MVTILVLIDKPKVQNKSIQYTCKYGGVEIADWTVVPTIPVWLPAYPHCVWALWWQGGKRRLQTSQCPCWGRLGTTKSPSCPWRWVPGSRSRFGNWTTVPSLNSWNIAECDVKPQPTNHIQMLTTVVTRSWYGYIRTKTSVFRRQCHLPGSNNH